MKLTFTGDSLSDIHFQIKQAAKELSDNISYPTDNTEHCEMSGVALTQPDITMQAQTAVGSQPLTATHRDTPIDLDVEGTPYDPAIHTSTKAKTGKGVWKKRPGGVANGSVKTEPANQPANVASMERAAEQQPASWQPPVTGQTTAFQPTTAAAIQHHENAGPAIGAAPSMHNFESFKANLMTIVVRLINEGKMDRAYMQELNQFFGVSNLWDVKNDDAKARQLFDLFIQYQFIMGA